jgi:hypothetical protein
MTSITTATLAAPLRRHLVASAPLVLGALTAVGVGALVQAGGNLRLAIVLAVTVGMVGVSVRSPWIALPILATWLVALGLLRRLILEAYPAPRADPLLLVAPFGFAALVAVAAQFGAFRRRTTLANSILILNLLMLVGAVNPLQGSIAAGVAGLFFVLVPTLAFWFGRALCDDRTLSATIRLVAVLGVAAAAYGLMQTFNGFPRWDLHWVSTVQFQSLYVNGTLRPFSSFSSAAEYTLFLGIAILIWLLLARRALPLALSALALLIPALFYASARGVVVLLVCAIGIVLAAQRRLPIPLAGASAVVMLVALVLAARFYAPPGSSAYSAPAGYGSAPQSALASHQVQGLANPLDPQTSTAGIHLSLIGHGILHAFSNPLGLGVGAVTLGGNRFGGLTRNTEADPSNVAVALGLPGLLAYLAVLGFGFQSVYRLAVRRRDLVALAALGLVVVTFPQWLNGGLYSVAFLPWLALGWADRQVSGEGGQIVLSGAESDDA